jgi:hypothetical protein
VKEARSKEHYTQLGNDYETEIITYRIALCLQIWRIAANIFNKQSQTVDKGWSSSLGVGRGDKNSSPYKNKLVTKYHKGPPTWRDSLDERPNLRKRNMRLLRGM